MKTKTIERDGHPYIVFTAYVGYDGEEEWEIPARYRRCGHCDGRGKSSAYLGAFTQEDREQESSQFWEDYTDGAYDRPCQECGGKGSVAEPDDTAHAARYAEALAYYHKMLRDDAEAEAEYRSEMRLG